MESAHPSEKHDMANELASGSLKQRSKGAATGWRIVVGVALAVLATATVWLSRPKVVGLGSLNGPVPISSGPLGELLLATEAVKVKGRLTLNGTEVQFTGPGNSQVSVTPAADSIADFTIELALTRGPRLSEVTLKLEQLDLSLSKPIKITIGNSVTTNLSKLSSEPSGGQVSAEIQLLLAQSIAQVVVGGLFAHGDGDTSYESVAKLLVQHLDIESAAATLRPGDTLRLPNGGVRVAAGTSMLLEKVHVDPNQRSLRGDATFVLNGSEGKFAMDKLNFSFAGASANLAASIELTDDTQSLKLIGAQASVPLVMTNVAIEGKDTSSAAFQQLLFTITAANWSRSRNQAADTFSLASTVGLIDGHLEMKTPEQSFTITGLTAPKAVVTASSESGRSVGECTLDHGLTIRGWSLSSKTPSGTVDIAGGPMQIGRVTCTSQDGMTVSLGKGVLSPSSLRILVNGTTVEADFAENSTVVLNRDRELVIAAGAGMARILDGDLKVAVNASRFVIRSGEVVFPMANTKCDINITQLANPSFSGSASATVAASVMTATMRSSLDALEGPLLKASITGAEPIASDMSIATDFSISPESKTIKLRLISSSGIGVHLTGRGIRTASSEGQDISVKATLPAINAAGDLLARTLNLDTTLAINCEKSFAFYTELKKILTAKVRFWVWIEEPFTQDIAIKLQVAWDNNGKLAMTPTAWSVPKGSPIKLKGELNNFRDAHGTLSKLDAPRLEFNWIGFHGTEANPAKAKIDELMGHPFILRDSY